MKQSLTMYKLIRKLITLFLLLIIQMARANSPMQTLDVQVLGGGSSSANFQGSVSQSDADIQALIFENTIPLNINFSITVAPMDEAKPSQLYLAANYNGAWFFLNKNQNWQAMQADLSDLQAYTSKKLQAKETINVVSKKLLGPGEYLLYAGYLNHENKVVFNKKPLGFIVFSSDSPELHRFQSESLLTTYFKQAIRGDNSTIVVDSGSSTSGAPTTTLTGDVILDNTSATNTQEDGVDESDIIKTDGQHIYALDYCKNLYPTSCLYIYQISESPASNQLLSSYQFDSQSYKGSIYLTALNHQDSIENRKMLVRVSSSGTPYWQYWYYPNAFRKTSTKVDLLDVSNPDSVQALGDIQLDGSLLSSRRIGNVLYLVTRTAPYIEGYSPYLPDAPNEWVTQAEIDENAQLLEQFSIDDIMPDITIGNNSSEPLHQINDCFLPPYGSYKYLNHSIISITAIPLDNPQAYYSNCFIGATETFYTSTDSVYLASSRFQYDNDTGEWETGATGKYQTDVHKFSLSDSSLAYKGSGSVIGDLGWDLDQKPFRMSEYNDELRIVTSINTWPQNQSSTSLTILRESPVTYRLEKIGGLDGIGKTNEILYAARFVGKRGYLVTFRKTDPLYVIDLEDGSNPTILAELEVEGFSDYLHPIGDTHLLGIGKNAVPAVDDEGNDLGFAWFQGVKISLFDVSSADSVSEVQAMEIGKRPTSSAITHDYHTFTFLDSFGSSPARFALPINLYEQVPEHEYFDSSNPNASYNWTHHGLYLFDLNSTDNPSFQLAGKLITAEAIPNYQYTGPTMGYSVIQGNTVHYFYNHKLYSSAISDLE